MDYIRAYRQMFFSVVNDDSPVKTEPLKVGSVMAQKI